MSGYSALLTERFTMNLLLPRILVLTCAFIFGVLTSFAQRPPTTAVVGYSPGLTKVEGNQPLTTTVVISITSPANLRSSTPVNITPYLVVLSAPEGVSDAEALSFVSVSPTTLSFNNPSETLPLAVQCVFPAGVAAGDYAYKIFTPGWGVSVQDQGAFLNATIYPPPTPGNPPVVDITTPLDGATFTFQPLVGPLTVPVEFTSTADPETPITAIDADLSGVELAITSVDNGDGSFTSTGSVNITAGGIYMVNARASNSEGTAIDNATFTVVVDAPPPTAAIDLPTLGTVYTLPTAGGTVSVPYSFSGRSYYGGMTSLTATLNGSPVNFIPSGLGSAIATGSGSFVIGTGGTYELVVTAVDGNGTATARTSFSVNSPVPVPTPAVAISQPLDGATFTRVAGSAPTQIPFSYTGTVGNGFTITSLTGTLNGSSVTATVNGIGTGSATGTGTLSVSAPGTYTLTATAASGSVTAATSVTFTVTETTPPPPAADCGVNWLPPISLGHVVKGGSTFAIKFELDCGCENGIDRNGDGDPDHYPGQRTKSKTKIDKTVIVAVSEVLANGTTSAPQLYTYGSTMTSSTYTIQGNDMYHLNYLPARGKRLYRVEVFQFPHGSATPVVIGTREFRTK